MCDRRRSQGGGGFVSCLALVKVIVALSKKRNGNADPLDCIIDVQPVSFVCMTGGVRNGEGALLVVLR